MTRSTSKRLVRYAWLLATAALFTGCRSVPPLSSYAVVERAPDTPPMSMLTPEAYESLKRELRPGDIIMGGNHDPTSVLIRLSMDEYGFHTHSGIIDIRDGEVVVSHATGRFNLLHGSSRLLGKVEGSVRADDLETFIREYMAVQIVRLPDPVRNERLAMLTRACERRGILFDPFFETRDPRAVHCSEYTARSLLSVGYGDHIDLARRTPNESMSELMRKVGVVTDTFIRVDGFAEGPGVRTIARLSRFHHPEATLAVEDAIGLLHERVVSDPDLRVGDIVACSAERLLHFTPLADAYLRAAVGLAQASPTGDRDEIRRRNTELLEVVAGVPAEPRVTQVENDPGIAADD